MSTGNPDQKVYVYAVFSSLSKSDYNELWKIPRSMCWEFPNVVVSNLVVCDSYALLRSLRSFAPFCALLRTCARLRSFALFARSCMFLRPTAFRTTASGNCRK